MSQNPINLALRFLLELVALFAMGAWGWTLGDGLLSWAGVVLVPLAGALLWGILRVPGDPGDAPVAVPGVLRLLLEVLFFGFAAWAFWATYGPTAAGPFAAVVLVHYALSFDRIGWLLRR